MLTTLLLLAAPLAVPSSCAAFTTPAALSRPLDEGDVDAARRALAGTVLASRDLERLGPVKNVDEQRRRRATFAALAARAEPDARAFLKSFGWPTTERGGDALATALVENLLIASNPPLLDCAVDAARATMTTPADKARYAKLVDSRLARAGQPQRYGTVTYLFGDKPLLGPVEDPGNLDARRATLGLPPVDPRGPRREPKVPAGLPAPVNVPAPCRTYTTSEALNRRLSLDELARLEARVEVLVRDDQAARVALDDEAVRRVDRASTAYVKSVLKTFGWPSTNRATAYLSRASWLLVQHADAEPALQACVLDLITAQASTLAEQQDRAYLLDRVRTGRGEPQVYGTQVAGPGTPKPIEDAKNVDARRAAIGLEPLKEYLERFK